MSPAPASRDAFEQHFAERVRATRKGLRLTQSDLAARLTELGLATTATSVNRIENGTRGVRLGEAHLIAAAFGTDLAALVAPPDRDAAEQDLRDIRRALAAEEAELDAQTHVLNDLREQVTIAGRLAAERYTAVMQLREYERLALESLGRIGGYEPDGDR